MAHKLSKITLAVLSATTLSLTATTNAQESQQELNEDVEVIEVSGIRASLASAMNEKRFKNNLVEVIEAEDIGKLPDQNLAEVLEILLVSRLPVKLAWGQACRFVVPMPTAPK
ncbi:TonB-dependent receptor [Alteromonas macleodii ATCC 27126]|nr:TonB-dependent receptor [Alteromonas macleodii ATCC 27126]